MILPADADEALASLEALDVRDGSVLVLRHKAGAPVENVERLAQLILMWLGERGLRSVLLVTATPGIVLEHLDAAQMARAGWVRAAAQQDALDPALEAALLCLRDRAHASRRDEADRRAVAEAAMQLIQLVDERYPVEDA